MFVLTVAMGKIFAFCVPFPYYTIKIKGPQGRLSVSRSTLVTKCRLYLVTIKFIIFKWCLEYMLANYTHYTLTANIIMGLWISNRPTRAWDFKSNIMLKESKAHENTFHFPKDILILKGCLYPQCWVGTNIHGLSAWFDMKGEVEWNNQGHHLHVIWVQIM